MSKPEFRVERGPEAEPEAFAVGLAKLLERTGHTIAAAELRRLHEENERLRVDGIHSCHAECQRPVCRLTRERGALLEALKFVIRGVPDTWEGVQKARAAIKAVEEGK